MVRFRQPGESDESDLLKAASASSNHPTSPHPSISSWQRFVRGSANESELAGIEEHLSECQHCANILAGLRRTKSKRISAGWLLAAAAFVLALAAVIWLRPSRAVIALDLRELSPDRGAGASEAPIIEFPRSVVALSLTLPVGSKDGQYQIGIFPLNGVARVQTLALARTENGITTLNVKLDLRRFPAGLYRLAMRHQGSDWEYYRLALK